MPKLSHYYSSIYSRVADSIARAMGKTTSFKTQTKRQQIHNLGVSSLSNYFWCFQAAIGHFCNAPKILCNQTFYLVGVELNFLLFIQGTICARIAIGLK